MGMWSLSQPVVRRLESSEDGNGWKAAGRVHIQHSLTPPVRDVLTDGTQVAEVAAAGGGTQTVMRINPSTMTD